MQRQICISTSTSTAYDPRQWLLTVQVMVNDLLNYLSFLMSRQLPVVSWSVCAHFSPISNYLFPSHTREENIQFLASRYRRIETFHCVLCFIVACGVMQVVLKEIAIFIRRTSNGNKVKKIVARSFLVKTIRLNGMTRNFGRHSSSFGRHDIRRNDSRATWLVSDWCITSYKLYRSKMGAV